MDPRPQARLSRRAALGLAALALAACGGREPETAPKPAAPAAEALAAGRLVIDVREPEPFAAGHLPGALNLQLGWDQLVHRVASYVPDRATALAVRAPSAKEAAEALERLAELGYDDALALETDPSAETATLELWSARELGIQLAGSAPPTVIDIRSAAEFESGWIDGALRVDQDEGLKLLPFLSHERTYAVICEGGWRSSQLASAMRREGFAHVVNVIDGMAGWRALDD